MSNRHLVDSILEHKSVRQYDQKPMPEEDKETLFRVIQSVPSSFHGQNCSVILVEDAQKRKELAQLAGNPPYVEKASLFFVIVIDFYRNFKAAEALGKKQVIHGSAEGLMVGTIEAGILLQALIVAAEAMGYGTVPIGGVRQHPEKVIQILDLPLYTFPAVGLCIGFPMGDAHKKPRLARKAVIFKDTYQREVQMEAIEELDQVALMYNKKFRDIDKNWSQGISETYETVYFPKVYEVLKQQGFTMDQ